MRAVFLYNPQYDGSIPGQSENPQYVPANSPMAFEEHDLIILSPMGLYQAGPFFPRREREIRIALRSGKSVVFLVQQTMIKSETGTLMKDLIATKGASFQDTRLLVCVPVKPEFSTYCDRYGHTQAVFSGPCDVLIRSDEGPAGIVCEVAQGLVFALPFQMAPQDAVQWSLFFPTLIQAVEDYLAARATVLPDWLRAIHLPLEADIVAQKHRLEQELEGLRTEEHRLGRYKSLLVAKSEGLVSAVQATLDELLESTGCKCVRLERFIEDLWIDRTEGHEIIIEVKGTEGNVGRRHINDLDSHRDDYIEMGEHGITENFSALLVVNTFAGAAGIEAKDREAIHPNVIRHAVAVNVLVMRSLDLFRMLVLKQEKRISGREILSLLKGRGWLRVEDAPQVIR